MKSKKNTAAKFYVLYWDFNKDSLEYYDILPYFREAYIERAKHANKKHVQKLITSNPELKKYYDLPKNYEELRDFVKNESRYRFWGRCEYEMICCGWPMRKNEHKLDIHEQIMMNLDNITRIFYNELCGSEY